MPTILTADEIFDRLPNPNLHIVVDYDNPCQEGLQRLRIRNAARTAEHWPQPEVDEKGCVTVFNGMPAGFQHIVRSGLHLRANSFHVPVYKAVIAYVLRGGVREPLCRGFVVSDEGVRDLNYIDAVALSRSSVAELISKRRTQMSSSSFVAASLRESQKRPRPLLPPLSSSTDAALRTNEDGKKRKTRPPTEADLIRAKQIESSKSWARRKAIITRTKKLVDQSQGTHEVALFLYSRKSNVAHVATSGRLSGIFSHPYVKSAFSSALKVRGAEGLESARRPLVESRSSRKNRILVGVQRLDDAEIEAQSDSLLSSALLLPDEDVEALMNGADEGNDGTGAAGDDDDGEESELVVVRRRPRGRPRKSQRIQEKIRETAEEADEESDEILD